MNRGPKRDQSCSHLLLEPSDRLDCRDAWFGNAEEVDPLDRLRRTLQLISPRLPGKVPPQLGFGRTSVGAGTRRTSLGPVDRAAVSRVGGHRFLNHSLPLGAGPLAFSLFLRAAPVPRGPSLAVAADTRDNVRNDGLFSRGRRRPPGES